MMKSLVESMILGNLKPWHLLKRWYFLNTKLSSEFDYRIDLITKREKQCLNWFLFTVSSKSSITDGISVHRFTKTACSVKNVWSEEWGCPVGLK